MFNTRPRIQRSPIVFARPQASINPLSQQAIKTKSSICFLCLFDGLRTPSIRRLVRRPRTICNKPLLTFDPSFYAPSSETAMRELYQKALNCPVDITVDPSTQTVLGLLRRHATSIPHQRIVLHYYGHGCHQPSSDGYIYFFSEDRSHYKPLKIANIISTCSCPLCIILDCPQAAVLHPHLISLPSRDLFCFFSCAANESLPLSTDAPMDLFSSCLLSPFETALWWHLRRHSSVLPEPELPIETNREFLKGFFDGLLESIAFDTQTPAAFEAFIKDPSLASLARGFVLSQRVMLSFNIHPSALPDLAPMASHMLWNVWDIAIDAGITLRLSDASNMIYKIFIQSFSTFPSAGVFPLFSFFLKQSEFCDQAAEVLFRFLDSNDAACANAARSSLSSTILNLEKPSEITLIILAKITASQRSPFIENITTMPFMNSSDPGVIRAGILSAAVTAALSTSSSFTKVLNICIENAANSAPFSGILLGLILDKAGKLLALQPFAERFISLLNSEKRAVRASACFALGFCFESGVSSALVKVAFDLDPLVRTEVSCALRRLKNNSLEDDQVVIQTLEILQKDSNGTVRMAALEENDIPHPQQDMIVMLLLQSIKGNGFGQRYLNEVF